MPSDTAWLQEIKYIVWDLDGTLYQVTPEQDQQIMQEIYSLIAEAQACSLQEAKAHHQKIYSKLHSNTETLIAAGVDRDYVLGGAWCNEVNLKAIQPNPQLVQAFQKMAGIQHIINTNSPQKYADQKMIKLGFRLDDFVAVIGNPDTVGALKPNLEPYQYVLKLTQADPSQHLFVGDRYETDLAPAKQVGMYTALVHDQDDRADVSFPETLELLKWLSTST